MTLRARLERLEAQRVPSEPLRQMCRCVVKNINYRHCVAPLLAAGPERDRLMAEAAAARCDRCGALLYAGGVRVEAVDWNVPTISDRQDARA